MKLSKTYNPSQNEAHIYKLWEEAGVFRADSSSTKEHFSISMPPPNETGTLSLGHALFLTLQDILARYQRQQGKDVLWLPGTDHAALAVNAIIEKKLAEQGTDKHAIGREEFLRRTREFVGNSRETMLSQMRAMGASADWSRLRYTLDDALNRCVNETFVKMYNDGLIYRGARIVNWDPNLQTTISDDEIEYVEETTKFYTFKYGPFEIGTARPETKFGDKYVVMHPDDQRYRDYKHGDTFETEWINGPITATVIKDESIDPEFGTGVMTITPWHSHVDFEIAEKHGLDKEQIIDEQGRLLEIAGEFKGMPILEARSKIAEKLNQKGLLVKVDDNYHHKIAVNERGKGTIEPQIKLQWWIDVNKPVVEWKGGKKSLKEVLQAVVREGDVKIIPPRFKKTYFHWIDNLRDWCISRQIWWGHQVPAWYKNGSEEIYVGVRPPESAENWQQDPDTLDTWFSSALWTWSTLVDDELANDFELSLEQLLEKSPDFKAYHPTNVMETGWDILFFWVARMILSTTYMTGQVPFKDVYLHGMVRAEDGKKMSKSRPESIIDPLEVIPEYGTDALRMALVMGVSPGNDQNWGQGKIEANRNFCNKLWNIARYIETTVDKLSFSQQPQPINIADHWVIDKVNREIVAISDALDDYRFGEAYERAYHLVWDEVADWYIEASKGHTNDSVLSWTLESILGLLHPFAPFVTEAIWQNLNEDAGLLSVKPWPKTQNSDEASAQQFEKIKQIVIEIRHIKATLKMTGGELANNSGFISEHSALISQLARLKNISALEDQTGIKLTQGGEDTMFVVDRELAQKFVSDLKKTYDANTSRLANLNKRLSNPSYLDKAPEKLIEDTKKQIKELETEQETVAKQISQFESI